ncbi:MAG: FAD-binding oxidoreductase [Burkholderiales bacterium]|nr:FAD-binding oxidoreductase [Burkholderiales bacterium]
MSYDAIVVGGGLVGAAIAYGLCREGLRPAVLDEGDVALRASRGNFGLVWVQSKGLGNPAYQRWSRSSSALWLELAAALKNETGIGVGHSRPGGVAICLTQEEFAARARMMGEMRAQMGDEGFDYRMLDHGEVKELLPGIGPQVVGASWSPYDGHANPLYTLRALHAAIRARGGHYIAEAKVDALSVEGTTFSADTAKGRFQAPRLVLAAGLGNAALADAVGLSIPVFPVRGQVIVTERIAPRLRMPTLILRQTEEGSIMIGESREEGRRDDQTGIDVVRSLAARAIKTFPFLGSVRMLRTWAALRVMTPDGFPVYEQSQRHPGAFAATCHSGVTLAAAHALRYAKHVAAGALPEDFAPFHSRRFHDSVPSA